MNGILLFIYLYNKGTELMDQKISDRYNLYFTNKFYDCLTHNTHKQAGKFTPKYQTRGKGLELQQRKFFPVS